MLENPRMVRCGLSAMTWPGMSATGVGLGVAVGAGVAGWARAGLAPTARGAGGAGGAGGARADMALSKGTAARSHVRLLSIRSPRADDARGQVCLRTGGGSSRLFGALVNELVQAVLDDALGARALQLRNDV